jgi:hypothetical protein
MFGDIFSFTTLLFLTVSASEYYDFNIPPAPPYSFMADLRGNLTQKILAVQDLFPNLKRKDGVTPFSEDQKTNLGKLLKEYTKAKAALTYSPDLLAVEKNSIIHDLLDFVPRIWLNFY